MRDSELGMDGVGYMPNLLANMSLPNSDPKVTSYVRVNGSKSLSIVDLQGFGIPFGMHPRLFILWITTEAVIKKERVIYLGDSMNLFLKRLSISRHGGENNSLEKAKKQLLKLLTCAITFYNHSTERSKWTALNLTTKGDIFWLPIAKQKILKWNSYIELSQEFFEEITKHPVPVNIQTMLDIRRSPLRMDAYLWLTYKMYYMYKNGINSLKPIPLKSLSKQFGSIFKDNDNGHKKFNTRLKEEITIVKNEHYQEACYNFKDYPGRIKLFNSPPHVLPKRY